MKYTIKRKNKRKNKKTKKQKFGGMPPKKHSKQFSQKSITTPSLQPNIKHIRKPIILSYGTILSKLNWTEIAQNPGAMELIKENIEKINITDLSKNPNPEAIQIVASKLNELDNWKNISENPSALNILKSNVDKIDWENLFKNPNPETLDIVKNNIQVFQQDEEEANDGIPTLWDKMYIYFTKQPYAAEYFIQENPGADDHLAYRLTHNPSPIAIEYIKQHINEIPEPPLGNWGWKNLTENPSAYPILSQKNIKQKLIKNQLIDGLASNPNPQCLTIIKELLENNSQRYSNDFWNRLTRNSTPEAFNILLNYTNEIRWNDIVYNTNPEAIKYYEKILNPANKTIQEIFSNPISGFNLGQIHKLSGNPSAIYFLVKYFINEIDWNEASKNPNIMNLINEIRYQTRVPLLNAIEGSKETDKISFPPIITNLDWNKELSTYL